MGSCCSRPTYAVEGPQRRWMRDGGSRLVADVTRSHQSIETSGLVVDLEPAAGGAYLERKPVVGGTGSATIAFTGKHCVEGRSYVFVLKRGGSCCSLTRVASSDPFEVQEMEQLLAKFSPLGKTGAVRGHSQPPAVASAAASAAEEENAHLLEEIAVLKRKLAKSRAREAVVEDTTVSTEDSVGSKKARKRSGSTSTKVAAAAKETE